MAINEFMEWSQRFRAKLFHPILVLLTKMRIRPNHISFFRLLGGILFIYFFPIQPQLAVIIIIIFGVLDIFDGALARYQKRASDRGKFWDVLVDHMNYVLPLFALILVETFSVVQVAYQLMIVPIVFLLATIVESEHSKTDWIIRPYYKTIYFKIFGMIAIFLYAFSSINVVNETLLGLNIAMTLWTVYYVFVLHRRWAGHVK